ncbi:MAG: hypothetical protein NT124_03005 [Candidatus Dependentiae bacterium]|nr:hypothetical protein [Candidatus Dependentiae bacterium]
MKNLSMLAALLVVGTSCMVSAQPVQKKDFKKEAIVAVVKASSKQAPAKAAERCPCSKPKPNPKPRK